MKHNTTLSFLVLMAAALCAAPTQAQDNFKELIEKGEYEALADKLEDYLVLDKYDGPLKTYVQMNLDYLRRGAKPKTPGSEVILVRGAKNDKLYQMPNVDGRKRKDDHPQLWTDEYPSGGARLMLPNRIRYARRSWDDRLPLIDTYFREGTDLMGGDGDALRELEKVIEHHKGGGLGTSANSTKSVLISASTKPLWAFGPPYYIIKVAPERCIFNYKGLSGEYEILLPFWVLPNEIVVRCDSREEVENHPVFKENNPYKDLEFYDYSSGSYPYTNNWELIEDNIRNGRPALPINPEGIRSIAGTVEVSGSKVSVNTGSETFRLSGSLAKQLKKFEDLTVRLKGKVDGESFDVDEIVSPVESTLNVEVSVSGDDVSLYTDGGDYLKTSGSIVRVLKSADGDLVKVEGWLFTNNWGSGEHLYVTAAHATATDRFSLRAPAGAKVEPGDAVRISYVSRSGKSAIVKTDDGWGWVKVDRLDLKAPVSAGSAGIAGSMGFGN